MRGIDGRAEMRNVLWRVLRADPGLIGSAAARKRVLQQHLRYQKNPQSQPEECERVHEEFFAAWGEQGDRLAGEIAALSQRQRRRYVMV